MCGGYDGCGGRALSQSPDDEKYCRAKRKNQIRFAPCSAVSAHATKGNSHGQVRTVCVCSVRKTKKESTQRKGLHE